MNKSCTLAMLKFNFSLFCISHRPCANNSSMFPIVMAFLVCLLKHGVTRQYHVILSACKKVCCLTGDRLLIAGLHWYNGPFTSEGVLLFSLLSVRKPYRKNEMKPCSFVYILKQTLEYRIAKSECCCNGSMHLLSKHFQYKLQNAICMHYITGPVLLCSCSDLPPHVHVKPSLLHMTS